MWWLSIGLALQVIGLVLAVYGIAATKYDLFPGRPLPDRRVWWWAKRTVLRRPGTTHTIEVGGSVGIGGALSALVQTLPARPDASASAGEWAVYLEKRIDNLAELRDRDQDEWKQRTNRLSERLDSERSERVTEDAQLAQRIGTAIGGEGGRGLDVAWLGLVITLFGTLIAGLAGIATT